MAAQIATRTAREVLGSRKECHGLIIVRDVRERPNQFSNMPCAIEFPHDFTSGDASDAPACYRC
jgi:hypothetical protein